MKGLRAFFGSIMRYIGWCELHSMASCFLVYHVLGVELESLESIGFNIEAVGMYTFGIHSVFIKF